MMKKTNIYIYIYMKLLRIIIKIIEKNWFKIKITINLIKEERKE